MTKMDKLEYAKSVQEKYGDHAKCFWVEVGDYIALLEEVEKLRADKYKALVKEAGELHFELDTTLFEDTVNFCDDLLEESQRERDRESEIHNARYGF